MNTPTPSQLSQSGLPGQRVDKAGIAHVDLRAVLALAVPLVANSAVQTLLNLTDLWFIGHISTTALAGVGRKTANLVLILSFKSLKNVCVDTHVHRISNRLGWVRTRTPEETEQLGVIVAPAAL